MGSTGIGFGACIEICVIIEFVRGGHPWQSILDFIAIFVEEPRAQNECVLNAVIEVKGFRDDLECTLVFDIY